jgi:hypothetical protein
MGAHKATVLQFSVAHWGYIIFDSNDRVNKLGFSWEDESKTKKSARGAGQDILVLIFFFLGGGDWFMWSFYNALSTL